MIRNWILICYPQRYTSIIAAALLAAAMIDAMSTITDGASGDAMGSATQSVTFEVEAIELQAQGTKVSSASHRSAAPASTR